MLLMPRNNKRKTELTLNKTIIRLAINDYVNDFFFIMFYLIFKLKVNILFYIVLFDFKT
jgi:hypothetical protein